jgi:hypothetical protein
MDKYRYIDGNSTIEVLTLGEIPEGVSYEIVNEVEISQFDINASKIQLFECYPELKGKNHRLLMLDNLYGIVREEPIANKGLKGEKKYYKDGILIWSSEKKYWFEPQPLNPDGFVRVIKLFDANGNVFDTWNVNGNLTTESKEFFLKKQRELIFEYFKSQQSQLFQLLYMFFSTEINDYVMIGSSALANTLIDAKDNHPSEVVKGTLSMEVPTQSGGTTTVLNGILAELV